MQEFLSLMRIQKKEKDTTTKQVWLDMAKILHDFWRILFPLLDFYFIIMGEFTC